MQSFWRRSARALALRVNVGWALALGAPRVGAACLLGAVLCLLLRHLGAPAWAPFVASVTPVVGAALWTARLAWPRRYSAADALCRLDNEAGLGGALLAAAEGLGPWPERRPVARPRWRLGRVWPGVTVAPAILVAATLVPLEGRARTPPPPVAPPIVWGQVQDALQILDEEPLVEPADLDRWKDQLEALERLPPEQWFDEETQEAADAVWSQLRGTVARTERAIEPVERALESAGRALDDAGREAAQQDLRRAMKGLEDAGVSLDPSLAEAMKRLDPEDLPAMPEQAREQLRQRLAQARAAGRLARGAPGEGDPEDGDEPGAPGGVERGPGTAPIELEPEAARRLSERTDTLPSERDPARDALSDVVRVDAIAPEVDEGAYRGPTTTGGTEHLGRGGQAVWRLVLDPTEQALLERYFE